MGSILTINPATMDPPKIPIGSRPGNGISMAAARELLICPVPHLRMVDALVTLRLR